MALDKKQKIGIGVLAGLVIIFALSAEAARLMRQQHAANLNSQESKLESLVSPEDRKPLALPPKARTIKVPILMYHHIGDPPAKAGATRRDLTVSVEEFETQAKWLRDQGFVSTSLNDIYKFSLGKLTLPKKPVVFTFDDGYDDVFVNAIPILKKYGFVGSFGIITQYPSAQLGDNFYASWQEIVQAKTDGNEIVCHTQNHFDGTNPKFTAAYIFQNLSGCQSDLQNHLGSAEPVLIYPYGHYNPTYLEEAKKAGFVMGITVHEGDIVNLDNLMEVPRVRIHGREDFERFKRLVSE